MKLSNLANHILNEQSREQVTELLYADCKHFYELNADQLFDHFFLLRGTKDHGDFAYRGHRTRKEILGDPFRYYFYHKMKPNSVPDRDEMFSAMGGAVSSSFSRDAVYAVFPIGSNYKLVWHPEVYDFNDREISGRKITKTFEVVAFNTSVNIKKILNSDKINDLDSKVVEDLIELRKAIKTAFRSEPRPDKIIDRVDRIIKVIKENYGNGPFVQYVQRLYDTTAEYKYLMKEYFEGLKLSQSIDPSMKEREVGIYAPDGVYYVKRDRAELIFEEN